MIAYISTLVIARARICRKPGTNPRSRFGFRRSGPSVQQLNSAGVVDCLGTEAIELQLVQPCATLRQPLGALQQHGLRGCQMLLAPDDLVRAVEAQRCAIATWSK